MESATRTMSVHYRTAAVGDVNVFYREAGPDSAPVVLLLHGFPSSSRMFRDLIPRLSDADRGAAPLIDRSHRVEPKSVSLTRELNIEGTHQRAWPDRPEDLT